MTTHNNQLPKLYTRAEIQPSTLNDDKRTVEVTWSTGAQVRRYDWLKDQEVIEELSLAPNHVRLDRLNNGAPLLPDHNKWGLGSVIGVVERAWLVGNEGRAVVRFSKRDDVEPIYQEVKDKILRNISVGYKINKLEDTGQKQDGKPIYRAIDWEPVEISLVVIPADIGAQVRGDGDTYSVQIITREAVMDPESQPSGGDVTNQTADLTSVRSEAVKQERERIRDIRAFGIQSRCDTTFIDGLIDRGLSASEAKEQIIEQWAKKVDSETSRSDTSVTVDARDKFIEAGVNAILGRGGFGQLDKENQFRGFRLPELARHCLERAQIKVTALNELEIVGRAFTQTSSDFPVLLESAMHKVLQNAYQTQPGTWDKFCAVGSVSDFRAHNRYRTGSFGNLDTLTEGGEFKNKSIPDGEKGTITIDTKGNIINITRKAIINDDLGAFLRLAQDLGMAAKRTIDADVFALLAANPTMEDGVALFHASHGNLSASGNLVTVASVNAGRVAMSVQKDVSGNDYLDLSPSVWLGGKNNGGTARVVNESIYDPDATNKLQKPNMVRGLFSQVIDSPRISGSEWYLVADPLIAPAIEVAFLNGEQNPYLESEQGFSMDGIRWKVRLDYGVAAIDYRGIYKDLGD